MAKSAKTTIIGGLVLVIVGIGLIAGILIYKKSADAKIAAWPKAVAVVVDVETRWEKDSDGEYETTYVAVLEYKVDGKTYKMRDSKKSIRPSLGSEHEISYNPNNPADYISAPMGITIPSIIFIAFGGLSAVMVVLLILIVVKSS